MSHDPRSFRLPDEVPIPLAVLQQIIGAGERSIDALRALEGLDSEQAAELDEAVGEMTRAVLRHIGLSGDEE